MNDFPRFASIHQMLADLEISEILAAQGRKLDAVEIFGHASYVASLDTIYLSDDNIHTVVHELCERDIQMLIGHCEFRDTYVSHILSPFKGGLWGRWSNRLKYLPGPEMGGDNHGTS